MMIDGLGHSRDHLGNITSVCYMRPVGFWHSPPVDWVSSTSDQYPYMYPWDQTPLCQRMITRRYTVITYGYPFATRSGGTGTTTLGAASGVSTIAPRSICSRPDVRRIILYFFSLPFFMSSDHGLNGAPVTLANDRTSPPIPSHPHSLQLYLSPLLSSWQMIPAVWTHAICLALFLLLRIIICWVAKPSRTLFLRNTRQQTRVVTVGKNAGRRGRGLVC
jgi:hypothetical protein